MNRRTLILFSLLVTLLFAFGCSSPQSAPEVSDSTQFQTMAVNTWETKSLGGFSNVAVYTPNTTSPIGAAGKQSLLIVLHGCTQSYTAFKTAKLEAAASQYGMVIAAPDAMNKAGFSCWDYWGATKSRTSGDYKNLINLAKYFTDNTNVDPAQVYIAGLSSGGAFAMTTACLAPDIFAGMGIDAGPSAGTSSNGAFSHESTASQTATRCQGYAGTYKTHFATQVTVTAAGTSDNTVPQTYAPQNAEAMAIIYGATKNAGSNALDKGTEYLWNISGKNVISQLKLTGVGHAWPGGTGASGSYIDGTNLNFGVYLAEFFKNNNRRISRDNILPVVNITSPANGATVSGTVAVAANATDEAGIAKVEFYVNGALKTQDTTSPYSYSWNASAEYNGNYTLTAKAYDANGNTAESAVTVTVTGGATDTTAPTVSLTSPTSGATVSGAVTISANASDAGSGIAKVEFFVGASKVGEDTTSPYSISFDSTSVADGSYAVKAKATDGAGNVKEASLNITVQQFAPKEYTATNSAHKTAGRAYVSGYVSYYATGSGASLGLMATTTTLCETAPGYFVLGACPTSGGGTDPDPIDPDPVDPDPVVNCFTATNSAHKTAGRATYSFVMGTGYVYQAVGSKDALGSYGTTSTTLAETAPGYFTKVTTCP